MILSTAVFAVLSVHFGCRTSVSAFSRSSARLFHPTARSCHHVKPVVPFRLWMSPSDPSLSSSSTLSSLTVSSRLALDDRFGRWRFLQRLLDGDVNPQDANEVILLVLRRSVSSSSQKKERMEGEGTLPFERLKQIQGLLDVFDDDRNRPLIAEGEDIALNPAVADQLDALLPGPDDDEDAFKGLWDTVIELHGREAVKIDEARGSSTWEGCCTIARLLIHYDFLSDGA